MTDLEQALRTHRMWFGTYTRNGELKRIQVWCFVHHGRLEFMTHGNSLKVKRLRRNPRVVCNVGAENGPSLQGTGEVISDAETLWRGYRTYWKTHPWMMLLLSPVIRKNIRTGKQVLIRITPDDPKLLEGVPDSA